MYEVLNSSTVIGATLGIDNKDNAADELVIKKIYANLTVFDQILQINPIKFWMITPKRLISIKFMNWNQNIFIL